MTHVLTADQTFRDAPERVRPAPPAPGPVFVSDCASAADHATLLLALWRRWEAPPES